MIKFFNIKTKEVRNAETEPHIAALWGSSDKGPNANVGQDMGWRLAPEVVVKVREIRDDFESQLRIAKILSKNIDELTEPDLLSYLSQYVYRDEGRTPVANDGDYTDEYNEEIRRLERRRQKEKAASTEQK